MMSHFLHLPRMAPSPWFHTTSVRIGIIGIGISIGPRAMKIDAALRCRTGSVPNRNRNIKSEKKIRQ
jgi:hypothetical protein